jgi:hypothetical protein
VGARELGIPGHPVGTGRERVGRRRCCGALDFNVRLFKRGVGDSDAQNVMAIPSAQPDLVVPSSVFDRVHIWATVSGKAVRNPMKWHHGGVLSVAATATGTRLVSGGDDGRCEELSQGQHRFSSAECT